MSVLVAYASKYGSTQGIAEQVAGTLRMRGLQVELRPLAHATDLAQYDAFVIGSAAYIGSWLMEARDFVRRHRDELAAKPLWLFSSGPVGTATKDKEGRDVLVTSEPKEFIEFAALNPRGTKVFFGALDSKKLRGVHRLFSLAPASDKLLIEGDFRDWKAIEEWADGIAHELAVKPVATR